MEVKRLWFENDKIFILTTEGKTLWQSLLWYPRLLRASDSQREKYSIDAMGIRWEELDEDISLESFEYDDPEPQGVARLFREHPELNVSAIARGLGIQQSLLAAYISGTKTPSKEREKLIIDYVHRLGEALVAFSA